MDGFWEHANYVKNKDEQEKYSIFWYPRILLVKNYVNKY